MEAIQMTTETDDIQLYRCKICGKLSVSRGFLHGHIESHRSGWRFYRVGNPEFLREHTETLEITECEVVDS